MKKINIMNILTTPSSKVPGVSEIPKIEERVSTYCEKKNLTPEFMRRRDGSLSINLSGENIKDMCEILHGDLQGVIRHPFSIVPLETYIQ